MLKGVIPILLGVIIAVIPPPAGLQLNAWLYFALFAAVIAGLVLEPIPAAAIGVIGVVAATVSGLVFPKPGDAVRWALSGFSNTIVWLIFAAFLFAYGYNKTGLGKRIALYFIRFLGGRTLGLAYAIGLSDIALAPFMPSNTARGGGTIYPIISNIPPMYGSKPGDGTERKIGSYIMWNAFAINCVTSSMFITALAPNLLVVSLAAAQKITLEWLPWFIGFAPVGLLLVATVPLITYKLYPPEIKRSPEVTQWASQELSKLGRISIKEIVFLGGVVLALLLWTLGTDFIDATATALLVVSIMLVARIFDWRDILSNTAAWNVLVWFGTLVTLADGLARVGFVKYAADAFTKTIGGFDPTTVLILIILFYFFIHYAFASITAHVTAVFPVVIASLLTFFSPQPLFAAFALAYTHGIMGVISPYATGPAPIFYGSGYIKSSDFWKLGFIFGLIYLIALIVIGIPWLSTIY
ncbi:MAG: anion permease [Candidatus Caldarchaeum sp.]|nr:anion permease [Candidatus Caldarchaeum sp.]